MNAKFAVALILTLQVSMSFCEDPPQDLVENYNRIKEKLYKRLENLVARSIEYAGAYDQGQRVREQLEGLPANPRVVALRQVTDAIRKELEPYTERVRHEFLNFYNNNLRQEFRPRVEAAIAYISNFLDQYAPAE